jgi:phosphatidylinositol glycan class M
LDAVSLLLVWLGAQAVWLQSAYQLEFLAQQAFFRVWVASVLFFLANAWILTKLVRSVDLKN